MSPSRKHTQMHKIRLPITGENLISPLPIQGHSNTGLPRKPRDTIASIYGETPNRLIMGPQKAVQLCKKGRCIWCCKVWRRPDSRDNLIDVFSLIDFISRESRGKGMQWMVLALLILVYNHRDSAGIQSAA